MALLSSPRVHSREFGSYNPITKMCVFELKEVKWFGIKLCGTEMCPQVVRSAAIAQTVHVTRRTVSSHRTIRTIRQGRVGRGAVAPGARDLGQPVGAVRAGTVNAFKN